MLYSIPGGFIPTALIVLGASATASFIGAIVGGLFIATPEQIAGKLHVATYASGIVASLLFYSESLLGRIALAIVGVCGGILGWLVYRGIIL